MQLIRIIFKAKAELLELSIPKGEMSDLLWRCIEREFYRVDSLIESVRLMDKADVNVFVLERPGA